MINSNSFTDDLPVDLHIANQPISGLGNGSISIIAGINDDENTSLALHIAGDFAKNGIKVLYVTLRLKEKPLLQLFASCNTEVRKDLISKKNVNAEQLTRLKKFREQLNNLPLLFKYLAYPTSTQLTNLLSEAVHNSQVKLIIIDYLQNIHYNDKRDVQSELEIACIKLKLAARSLRVPILATSNLTPRSKKNTPLLPHQTYEGDDLLQHSDIVLFTYRPEKFGISCDENGFSTQNKLELHLVKNKLGELDTFPVKFEPAIARIQPWPSIL